MKIPPTRMLWRAESQKCSLDCLVFQVSSSESWALPFRHLITYEILAQTLSLGFSGHTVTVEVKDSEKAAAVLEDILTRKVTCLAAEGVSDAEVEALSVSPGSRRLVKKLTCNPREEYVPSDAHSN
jgi:hypothetical protein